MLEDRTQNELLALLAWWQEAGVSTALDDIGVDWTARGEVGPGRDFAWPEKTAAAAAPPVAPQGGPARAPGRPPDPQIGPHTGGTDRGGARPSPLSGPGMPAGGGAPSLREPQIRAPVPRREAAGAGVVREAVRRAQSLAEIEALLGSFDGCPLKATAKNLCFYRGSPQARLMVIGEAPGRDEDLAGKPFVGRAGQLLDRMLAAIGLGEADVHITNIVYWRPPGNRTPSPEEAQACRPFLERQIELVAPDFVLTLGGPAAKAMLEASEGIMRLRGKWHEIENGGRRIRVMPTLHPAYLLRQPDAKRQAWRDLLALKSALGATTQGSAP